ncbi:hypothetical protein CYLTODRAFT_402991 [Cylindrobasidium torrendii FP15055 ss-10]|uniref:Tyrosine specific protein phosphatases domain-containing protein n=1 Tax=Cylindrobasidium torrendii FP15055 ss-10 TaxID=1314674 RepID=A0A0D7B220_9AGAR|nr:hypothetical protein CYLTODRAFT_402991 [Cylindrobasidium torrendii FP15055 ss-10]
MCATLSVTNGALRLAGPALDTIVREALLRSGQLDQRKDYPHHATLLTAEERRGLKVTYTVPEVDVTHIYALGIGLTNTGKQYLVLVWALGQSFRRKLGLPPRHFSVSLREDDEDAESEMQCLPPHQLSSSPSILLLDHLVYTLHLLGDQGNEDKYIHQMINSFPQSEKGYLRMATSALQQGLFKLAMLAYAQAWEHTTNTATKQHSIKKMVDCSRHTEWGVIFTEDEKCQITARFRSTLCMPWSSELRDEIANASTVTSLCLSPRVPLFILPSRKSPDGVRLPRFFRWVVPFYLAVMSTPTEAEDIASLATLGIKHVLTLTEEQPLPPAWFASKPVSNTFIPVTNYMPPTIEQMTLILRLFEQKDNLPLLVHCGGGKGRAGTVAACYLAAYGFGRPQPSLAFPTMSAPDAIAALRAIRPESLETKQQEDFVSRWCSTIWKRQCILPDLPPEPAPCALEVDGELRTSADLLILVGLPGSGKSWLSQALMKRNPKGWNWICQDEAGSRDMCENAIGRAPALKQNVILDRCNPSRADRKLWLALASTWATSPVCVRFDYDRELCLSRAQQRTHHPTLRPGNRVDNAVSQMQDQMDVPTVGEGFKAVVTIRSFAACEELVARLSPRIDLLKFPRTPHLLNLGAATDDDVVLPPTNLIQGHAVITEKVDGANMGFSLSPDRLSIVAQNRSHYVNPSSHAQFKKLGHWIEEHKHALIKILGRDAHFPERYTLYGEWLYATHSIPYTRLPDWFMAFDMFDRVTGTFCDRQTLVALLNDSGIHVTPTIYEGPMPPDAVLKDRVQQTSAFWDGRIEGLYVKVEGDGVVKSRSKIVRADFIAGNEHWNRGPLRLNAMGRSG